jgi:drug/metabolite transporter (DMT)-like permease
MQGVFGKIISNKVSPLMGARANFILFILFLLTYLVIQGIPPIDRWNFSWATLLSYSINFFVWYIFLKSLQSAPLSHTMPFTAFTPLFLIPVAYIIIKELPTSAGIFGIILIF